MSADDIILLKLSLPDDLIYSFYPLFQSGFRMRVEVGCSVHALLCDQLNLDPAYVETRIQTIFLDNDAVDDLSTARIQQGSVLALSAAMPGLAGAVLRRGGKLACLRRSISHRPESLDSPVRTGFIVIKIFNLLLKELTPTFLRRGILFPASVWKDFVSEHPIAFWKKCSPLNLGGRSIKPETLPAMDWSQQADYVEIKNIA